jgi:hypothetical protein
LPFKVPGVHDNNNNIIIKSIYIVTRYLEREQRSGRNQRGKMGKRKTYRSDEGGC